MPELRQDFATKEWVIIATERAKRPEDWVRQEPLEPLPEHDVNCPFCPGNEAKTPPEVFSLREVNSQTNGPGWRVRAIPNKFAALAAPPEESPRLVRSRHGLYLQMPGIGYHEVIIESPRHNKSPATMSVTEVVEIILAYQTRYVELDRDPNVQLITIFRNHGPLAGASLRHPHSQLVATPVVPLHIRHRLYEAQRHYDALGTCVFCDMLDFELQEKERVILANEHFAAFVPYAARVPYEIWIVPREHQASFGQSTIEQAAGLAAVLQAVLSRLYHGLGDPDYNYVINTAPHHSSGEPFYHWHLQILPRLTTPAGFELGSGMHINVSLPEEAAAHLRSAGEPDPKKTAED
ncbi:MAG TPA: galactose-1-phosphate uridylyltransferase [Armatimonadetes bacterium]|nr:galactose-1-phosphate uridylyltransferase [Armatimonadota bacterium]